MADKNENEMKKKQAAKKRSSLLEKIVNAIGTTFVVLLIITCIVLCAPWKVTGLLIVILITIIIIPRFLEKWMWLAVAIFLTALVIWVFLPDDNEGWRPYTFDEELATMEAKRFVPAEDNAATIYKQLLESHDPNFFSKDFLSWENKDLILSEFWASKDYPEAASWLEDNQQIIDQLMLACEKDKCRFPIAGDIGSPGLKPPADFEEVTGSWWYLPGKRNLPMIRWGKLLIIISANNDIADGRIDEGLGKYIATLQMAKHLCQQPTPMDLQVGIAINLRGLEQINKYIVTGNATDEQLQLLNNVLKSIEYDWRSDLHQILAREKLMLKNFICAMFYQTNQEGKVRLNRDPKSTLRAQIDFHLIPMVPPEDPESKWKPMNPDSYGQIKLTKAMTMFWWFFVPSTPQKTTVIIDDIQKQYYSMADPEYDWQKEHDKFSLKSVRLNFRCLLEMMSRILEGNWPGIHDKYLRATAWKKASRLIIVLRRYKNRIGHWPESLEGIKSLASSEIFVDPINGGDFVYKLTEENFSLYSRGKNNIDERGERGIKEQDGTRVDDILFWPQNL